MEKLLLMGVSTDTSYVLDYAKKIGVWTIITDSRPADSHPVKQKADELWIVDIKDLDLLEAKCRQERVTAVYAGNHEICLDYTKMLCKRLDLPFYASDEAWKSARDKSYFKQIAQMCGLTVPKRYDINVDLISTQEIDSISYPVIVKPVDSGGARGISICESEKELVAACNLAKEASESKRIIVEEYITGTLIHATYVIEKGNPELLTIETSAAAIYNGKTYPYGLDEAGGKAFERYKIETDNAVNKLTKRLNCWNGILTLQAIVKNGLYFFIEMGYRLDGTGSWLFCDKLCEVNMTEYMVNLALGRTNAIRRSTSGKVCGKYILYTKEGFVSKIEGIDEIIVMNNVQIFKANCQVGKWTSASKGLVNVAYILLVFGDSRTDLENTIIKIGELLHQYDEDGNEMLNNCGALGVAQ